MTPKEAMTLVGIAAANFPALQDKDLGPTAELWYRMLADVPYELAERALLKVLATVKYFPTIAEVREAVAELLEPDQLSPIEAWGLVLQAVRKYGWNRQEEALKSLPEPVARVVRMLGWQDICGSTEIDVVRAHFLKAYEAQMRREKERLQVPDKLVQLPEKKRLALEGR